LANGTTSRDIFVDVHVFRRELERIFARAWLRSAGPLPPSVTWRREGKWERVIKKAKIKID